MIDRRYEKILDRIRKIPNQTVKDARNTLRYGNHGDQTKWCIKPPTSFKNNYDVGYHVKLFDNNNNTKIPDDEKETLDNSDEEIDGIFNNDDDDSVIEKVDETSTIIAEESED
ncbi:hypothetical protein U3516DRAFT_859676 [Neocallimastix sp. 'constans']